MLSSHTLSNNWPSQEPGQNLGMSRFVSNGGSEFLTVLIVDDDEMLLRFARTLLERAGYNVFTVTSGTQALLSSVQHSPSLTILDLVLPDRTGVDVCRAMRSWHRLPILVLSGRSDEQSVIEALEAGADGYLTKPFRPLELLARIRALHRPAGARYPFGLRQRPVRRPQNLWL